MGMTGTYACTGSMTGTGTYEASWTGDGHSKAKVHFTGTLTMRQMTKPVEWTMEANSVYKGPDCGSVQPAGAPGN
jgi:polyisoprenoid-binding protein YceI